MAAQLFDLTPIAVPRVETRHRRIVTPIPVPESVAILEELNSVETTAMHGQLPIVWDRAEGFQVFDRWGNRWIDFTSTIFVTNAGHSNPRILASLQGQVRKPLLHTYTFASQERLDYLRYLIRKTPAQFEKAFMLSAGTEATECALKLMRMHGQKIGKRRLGVIGFEGNWHGRTMGAQMLSFDPRQKEWIGYHDPNIHFLPFPFPWREAAMKDPAKFFESGIESLLEDRKLDAEKDLCGFMLETFQGWGAIFYPPAFVRALEAFARRHQMLVTFDEMQAGFGRTGELFGYMHYGVQPDILCCGKGAASGVPLAIVLGSREIMDLPGVGSMSSTHSGNPLVSAVGLANLQAIIEDDLVGNAKRLGVIFHSRLRAIQDGFPDQIQYVLGKGLIAAVHFRDSAGTPLSDLATAISIEAMRKGLIVVHTGRESIKLAPPLSISEDALLEGLDTLEESIKAGILATRL